MRSRTGSIFEWFHFGPLSVSFQILRNISGTNCLTSTIYKQTPVWILKSSEPKHNASINNTYFYVEAPVWILMLLEPNHIAFVNTASILQAIPVWLLKPIESNHNVINTAFILQVTPVRSLSSRCGWDFLPRSARTSAARPGCSGVGSLAGLSLTWVHGYVILIIQWWISDPN